MIEENSPAYSDAGASGVYVSGVSDTSLSGSLPGSIDPSNPYWDETVYYYKTDGSVVYTTRRKAIYHGFRFHDIGDRRDPATIVHGRSAGYSTYGKNFYPNSNYNREVKKTQKKGFLTTILDILI
jgi:hypothetical protein